MFIHISYHTEADKDNTDHDHTLANNDSMETGHNV